MGNKRRIKNITSTQNPAGYQLVGEFILVWLRRSLAAPPFPLRLIPGGWDVLTTNRSGVIGSTSQGTHQLISPTALCSRPCAQQSAKRRPTDAGPHAALPPANITSPCLPSLLQILLRSLCRAEGSAAGVAPCWGSRCIIALLQQTCHVFPIIQSCFF